MTSSRCPASRCHRRSCPTGSLTRRANSDLVSAVNVRALGSPGHPALFHLSLSALAPGHALLLSSSTTDTVVWFRSFHTSAWCNDAVVERTDDEAEEEEEEPEVEEEEEPVSEAPKPLPGLGDPSDLMLVEKWHGLFVGQRMEAAATSGHVVCTRSELACYVKIAVPPDCPQVRHTPLCACASGMRPHHRREQHSRRAECHACCCCGVCAARARVRAAAAAPQHGQTLPAAGSTSLGPFWVGGVLHGWWCPHAANPRQGSDSPRAVP